MDTRSNKEKIELFTHEAIKLQKQPFIEKTKGSIKITQAWDSEKQGYNETFEKFEYNDFVAILLDFRKFISNDEPIFIDFILNVLEKNLIDIEMKDLTRKARKKINEFKQKTIALSIGDKSFTYEDIKNMFINGYYFHLDQQFTDYLKQLPSDTFFRLRWFFFDYVSEYIGLILWLCNLILYSFENGLLDFSKEN